jgi:hypothetical protein
VQSYIYTFCYHENRFILHSKIELNSFGIFIMNKNSFGIAWQPVFVYLLFLEHSQGLLRKKGREMGVSQTLIALQVSLAICRSEHQKII